MSQQETLAWVWLGEVLGPCNIKLPRVLERFPAIEEVLAPERALELESMLAPAERERAKAFSQQDAARRVELCLTSGITPLCYGDERFPPQLREMGVPPAVLFVCGDIDCLRNRRAIGGVGSRYITQYGRDVIRTICAPLAQMGVTLISGLALGADAEVHKAALKNDGITVAVLGNGINQTVPSRHAELRRVIEQSGAVISEYPPGAGCGAYMFPQRNRLISGLSRAVVVFEAALKSGTMITANWALEDGRDVYAVPGSILSTQSQGTNHLIKLGAAPATCAEDVLPSLELAPPAPLPAEQLAFEPPAEREPLEGPEQKVYEALFGGPLALDDLVGATGMPPSALLPALTMLEMNGYAESMPGGRYRAL